MSEIREELLYSKTHEWVASGEKSVTVGLTDYAQHALGDIVFIDLPKVGDPVKVGESFCDVESVKAVSEVFSPVTGVITAVNDALESTPELLNSSCYDAWICKVEELSEHEDLLSAADYAEFLKKEEA